VPLFEPPALGHRVVPVTDGKFDGPGLAGRIRPVGADRLRTLSGGTTPVEAREHVDRSRCEFRHTVRYDLYRLI
jgi:hypothetical protein